MKVGTKIGIGVGVAAAVAAAGAVRCGKSVDTQRFRAHPDWTNARYAHRGLHNAAHGIPENSLAAFRRAADLGFGIELDVQLTADGEVVVFHDENLNRVCGVDRLLHDCTFAELQTYRLSGTSERIPRFADVLAEVAGRVPLIVEVKYYARRTELCEKTARLLSAYGGPAVIESFHPLIVNWWKHHYPQVLRGVLAENFERRRSLAFPASWVAGRLLLNGLVQPDFVAYRFEDRDDRPVRRFAKAGGTCFFWTIRSAADMVAAERIGGTVIFEGFLPNAPTRKAKQ